MTQIIKMFFKNKRDWTERGILGKRSDGGVKEINYPHDIKSIRKLRNLYLIYNYRLKPVRQTNGPIKLYTESSLL